MNSNTSKQTNNRLARKILSFTLVILSLIIVSFFIYTFLVERSNTQRRELEESLQYEQIFNSEISRLGEFSQGLAIASATNPDIQAAFAAQDRQRLQELTMDSFKALEQDFGIQQYQFHLAPATSFLRLHSPSNFGDDLSSFRFTVLQVNSTEEPVVGLEVGRGGLGLRGIEPVFYEGRHIGSVEFGMNIDEELVNSLKEKYGNDWRILLTRESLSLATLEDIEALKEIPSSNMLILASTLDATLPEPSVYEQVLNEKREITEVETQERSYSVTSIPLHDFSGKAIGVVDIIFDQTSYIQEQNTRLAWIFIIGLLSLVFSASSIVYSTNRSLRPLTTLQAAAEEMQRGNLDQQVSINSQDEIGVLASAFNAMSAQLREMVGSLEQRVADRTKALSNVAEISMIATAINNEQEMLATVVHLTQRRFGLYHAHVFLLDEATGILRIVACGWQEGDEHEGTHGTTTIPMNQEQSLVARAARTKSPVIINDVRSEPGWLPNPLLPDTAAELAVPLLVGEKVIGVLDIQSDQKDIFTNSDADIQLTLSAQVAIAVQNLHQYKDSQKIANDLGVVAQVGIATATITNIDQLLQEVVDLSKRSFNLYHAHIYMLNEAGDTLQLTAGADEVGRKMVSEGRSIPLDSEQSLVARAAQTHQGVVVNDVAASPDFLPHPLLPETRAEMAVPMMVGNNVIGVLDVQSEMVGRFTDVDVNIKTTLASQVAIAVQNARNFEQSKRQAEREAAVNLITQRIQNTTSVENALQVATRELGHILGMKPTSVTIKPAASDRKADN